ncbi:MAG: FAD-dependent oxidoreductase, partial [Rhodococcus ruber]|nr:FAD-dependent oxidoreductase [Rhodococcus ruber]
GHYGLPFFVERVQAYSDALHAEGAVATGQMVHQGGMPHGASSVLSAPVINNVPHKLNRDEIAYFVGQYKFCAEQAQKARLDGVELHMNHDDLLEYFLSPLTNKRDDEYGGSIENRCRFPVEVLRAIRDVIGSSMVIGIRLNLREEVPGGYDIHGAVEIAQYLESTGLVDYFHGVVGSPWGNPSYIQPHFYEAGQWSDLAGQLKRAVSLPVVHTGRINHPDVAERILAAGDADVVGMARAHIAEPSIVEKVRTGRVDEIRPCVGGNECISRRYVEGLPFGCAVNPVTSNEVDGPWPTVTDPRRVLVVGGGPAGMEFAALAREKGHDVELWEASDVLGGQLRTAINAPTYDMFEKYLDWQQRRLERAGVKVAYRHAATKAEIESAGFDVVAVATGSTRRIPDIPGVYGDNVADIRDVLNGDAAVGTRALVVAQDHHMPPPSRARAWGPTSRWSLPTPGSAPGSPPGTTSPSSTRPRSRGSCSAATSWARSSGASTRRACSTGSWRTSSRSPRPGSSPATSIRGAPTRWTASTRWCSPAVASGTPTCTRASRTARRPKASGRCTFSVTPTAAPGVRHPSGVRAREADLTDTRTGVRASARTPVVVSAGDERDVAASSGRLSSSRLAFRREILPLGARSTRAIRATQRKAPGDRWSRSPGARPRHQARTNPLKSASRTSFHVCS